LPPLLQFVWAAIARLFDQASIAAQTRFTRLAEKLHDCLAFHRPRFAQAGITDEHAVLKELRGSRLVHERTVREVESDVLSDLVLAQACCAQTPQAKTELLERFEGRIEALLQSSFSVHGRQYADERPDIWTICHQHRPRKQTPLLDDYHGRTFLWAWLRPIVIHLALRWQQRVRREVAEQENLSQESPQFTSLTAAEVAEERERMARIDSALLRKVVREVLSRLTPQEQLYVFWVLVEGRKKKLFAKLLDIKDYEVSRHFAPLKTRLLELVCEVAAEFDCQEELLESLQTAVTDKDSDAFQSFRQFAQEWHVEMTRQDAACGANGLPPSAPEPQP
jgi:hypothetical protein